MAIIGLHAFLNTPEPDALRAMLRDVFGFSWVHAHPDARDERLGNWLIFGMPPAELGVHPNDSPGHALSFMCDDIASTIEELRARGVVFVGDVDDMGWGLTTTMRLPGDLDVMLYEPRHPTAIAVPHGAGDEAV